MARKNSSGMSEDTKTIITVLLLLFAFPIGVVMTWVWMRWPTWVKVLLTALIIIPLIIVISAFSFLGLIGRFPSPWLSTATNNSTEGEKQVRDIVRLKTLAYLQKAIDNVTAQNTTGHALCNGESFLCLGDSADSIDKNPNVTKPDGAGWIKTDISNTISELPLDPINNSRYSYTYCSDGKYWEIQARVESKQLLLDASRDGGDEPDQYEVGTNKSICAKWAYRGIMSQ